jgi:hypothetical protein
MSDQQQIYVRLTKKENKLYKTGHSTNKRMEKGSENF